MSVLLATCAVVVTLAIAAIAIATIRAMRRFEETADEFQRTAEAIRASVVEAEAVTRQIQELAGALEGVVPPLKQAAHRFADLSDRAVSMSNVVLNQVEGPIRNTAALITGVRSGTRSLLSALTRRTSSSNSNGGYDHA